MYPNDLADALSITTGQPWQSEPISGSQHYALRCTADDTHLTVRIQMRRIEISGSFWQGETYLADYLRSSDYTPRQVITVSAERPAVAVAKEISRRLLPAFRADLAHARMIHTERMREVAGVEAFAN